MNIFFQREELHLVAVVSCDVFHSMKLQKPEVMTMTLLENVFKILVEKEEEEFLDSLTGRVLAIVAEIEAQMFGFAQKFNRRTTVELALNPPFCQTAVGGSSYSLSSCLWNSLKYFAK